MMDEFKKEAEAAEQKLLALLAELDKVGQDRASWTPPVVIPIDIDAAKDKLRATLRKEAGVMNGAVKGVMKSIFRQVDQPGGSTGDAQCRK